MTIFELRFQVLNLIPGLQFGMPAVAYGLICRIHFNKKSSAGDHLPALPLLYALLFLRLEVCIYDQRRSVSIYKIHRDNTISAMCVGREIGIDLRIDRVGYSRDAWNTKDQ